MNYSKLVPRDSFMGRYLHYMRTQETAHAFDWWCGMWCISAACGRRVVVARPRAPVFMNFYTILVGDSGVARKSTSVNTAGRLVRELVADDEAMGYIDAKMTGEKLDELLHNRTAATGTGQLCIAISELAVFLGTERYVANMPTLLTDLYDCPAYRHGGGTITRGECIQRNVFVTFLSASTPVWLLKTVNPNVVEGGFASRCLFVVSNQPKARIAWPTSDGLGLEEIEHDALLQDLQRMRAYATAQKEIMLSQDALTAFTKWYDARVPATDEFKQAFESREDAHVLRVAACLCINDETWQITSMHVDQAIELVTALKETSVDIFESTEHKTKYAKALDTIRAILIGAGENPVPRHQLFARCRYTVDNNSFLTLIDILHEVGAIQRYELRTGEAGRPTDYIRGTKLLTGANLSQHVLDRLDY